ncbi:hypothetical protein GCM10010178_21880 [Lentzea flava]|uniref:Uncharacterized protein n=1 Tax=Lentzea flava TaxID=103732 RepID=A0ABQ2UFJ8_9PSEU|nr:hypothetical protein GCM10010178_21880 [Lentzea flava]
MPPVTPTWNGPAGLIPSPDAGVTVSAAFALFSTTCVAGADGASGAALQAVNPSSAANINGLNTCSPQDPLGQRTGDAQGCGQVAWESAITHPDQRFPPIEARNWPVLTCSAMTHHTLG